MQVTSIHVGKLDRLAKIANILIFNAQVILLDVWYRLPVWLTKGKVWPWSMICSIGTLYMADPPYKSSDEFSASQ